jgi:hypothetical protein
MISATAAGYSRSARAHYSLPLHKIVEYRPSLESGSSSVNYTVPIPYHVTPTTKPINDKEEVTQTPRNSAEFPHVRLGTFSERYHS